MSTCIRSDRWACRPRTASTTSTRRCSCSSTAPAPYDPTSRCTDGNREAVAEICRRLDGMPLAIELAAARLRALTPPQIVDRLADRFRLLTSGSRTALPRHQTLRAVVEWSWDLLDPDEQAVARRLSLFSGGATLDAAEQVCSDDDLPAESVLGVLASLVDKSLVEAAADDRSVRYRMLETVRAYGAEQLKASGEYDRFRARAHDVLQPAAAAGAAEAAHRRADPLDRPADRRQREPARRAPDRDRHRLGRGRGRAGGCARRVLEHERPSGRGGQLDAGGARRTGPERTDRPGLGGDAARARHLVQRRGSRARSLPRAIRGLAEVRWMSPAASGGGRVRSSACFTNAVWAAIRRDKAGCFRALEAAREQRRPVDPDDGRDDDGDVPRERRRGRSDGGRPGRRDRRLPGDRRTLGYVDGTARTRQLPGQPWATTRTRWPR